MGLAEFYKEISTPKVPTPSDKTREERIREISNPLPTSGVLVVPNGGISRGGRSSRRRKESESPKTIELEQPEAEVVQKKLEQGKELTGSILLKDGQKTAGDIYREYGYDRGGSVYNPAPQQRYDIRPEYSPTTKVVLAQENIQPVDYETRREIASPGSSELQRQKEILQAFKSSQTGYEVPGGAQGIFTRAGMIFDRVTETVDENIPSEEAFQKFRTSKIGKVLYGKEELGQRIPYQRKDVIDVGSYFVPVYGEAKFMTDIGRTAEQGKYGEAVALASIPYVFKVGSEIPSAIKKYKQYKFIQSMQQKYSGALSTTVSKTDLVKAKELGIIFKGKEVKGIKFFAIEAPNIGRVSRQQIILGKEQNIPRKSLKEAEFYLFKQKGKVGGNFNENPLNLPALKGAKSNNLVYTEFAKNTYYPKKAVQNFLEGKLPTGRREFFTVTKSSFVQGEGTLFGLKFSRESSILAPKGKPGSGAKATLRLERSKPLNSRQSGRIIETGTANKPGSDYLLDRIRNELLVTIKKTEPKQIKIFKINQVIKPQVSTPGTANVPSGSGTQTIQILKTKTETSSIALNKVRQLTILKTESLIGQSRFTNMFKKQKPLYKVETTYAPVTPSKPITNTVTNNAISQNISGAIGFKIGGSSRTSTSPSVVVQEITKTTPETRITPKVTPEIRITPRFRFNYKYFPLQQPVQELKTPSTFKITSKIETPKVPKLELPKKKVSDEDEFLKSKGVGVGFQAFLKRKGKFVAVSPIVKSKLSALDIGTLRAKQTLGATFKVEQVKGKPLDIKTSGEFQRFSSEFRGYQIRGQKRIPLTDTYIQKSRFRLGTKSEVSEIQRAKKTKTQRWF
ncbi:MAG TPA: hypothetical protein PLT65_04365 [Bacilli bacterium]|nr:hypothetical protein [Bacilli bacterium]